MIGNLFYFRGQMGRLKYFLWSFILVPAAFFLSLLILPFFYVFGLHLGASKTTTLISVVPPLVIFLWTHLSLQAARIRDIGWKPQIIIPGFLLFHAADLLVTYFYPALAFGTKHFTVVSEVASTVLLAALLFIRGDADHGASAISFPDFPRPKLRKGICRNSRSEVETTVRTPIPPSKTPRPTAVPGRVSFGRRGL